MHTRPIIGLDFAAALFRRCPPEGGLVFVTSNESLATFGPRWALDLQSAVKAWDLNSRLFVDVNLAPAYGLEALNNGLDHLILDPTSPARPDMDLYAAQTSATIHDQRPIPLEHWTPDLPQRGGKKAKSKQRATSRS